MTDTILKIGKEVRRRRLELKLSINTLADKCKVDKAAISRLETGKQKSCSNITLRLLASGLGCTCDDLVIRRQA